MVPVLALATPRPRTRKARPLGVPAGILRVTGAPPSVGTLMSAPSAASAKLTGTVEGQVVALAAEQRVRGDLDGDVQVAGRAAALAGRALAAQPDPLAVLDAGGDPRRRSVRLDMPAPGAVAGRARVVDDQAAAAAGRAGLVHRERAADRGGPHADALAVRADPRQRAGAWRRCRSSPGRARRRSAAARR